jgi:hypothetical protein
MAVMMTAVSVGMAEVPYQKINFRLPAAGGFDLHQGAPKSTDVVVAPTLWRTR